MAAQNDVSLKVGAILDAAQFATAGNRAGQISSNAFRTSFRPQRFNLSNIVGGIPDAKKQFNQLTEASVDFNDSLERGIRRIVSLAAASSAIFGIARAFQESLKAAREFEKQLQDINVIANLPAPQLAKLGKDLFDVARNTKQSFEEVSRAATEFSRQGLSVEETLKRTEAAMILVNLAGLNSVEATKTITASINSFSDANLNAIEIVNKLVAVDAKFAVSSQDLADSITRVGSSAQDAGVNFDRLISITTAAQQVTQRGGAVIGNALKTIFTRLQRVDTLNALEDLGIKVRETSATTGEYTGQLISADKILYQLRDRFKDMTQEQRAQVAQMVAGVRQGNILSGILRGLTFEQEAYKTSVGATDEAVRRNAALLETWDAKLKQAGTTLQQLGANVGQIGFENISKNFLDAFNSSTIVKSLSGTAGDVGNEFGKVFIKSVADIITGPGVIALGFAASKLLQTVGKFGKTIVGEVLPGGGGRSRELEMNKQINALLQGQNGAISAIVASDDTRIVKEQRILKLLQEQSRETIRQRELIAFTRQAVMSPFAAVALASKTKGKAEGYIPNAAGGISEAMAQETHSVQRGVGGAPSSARPVYLPNFSTEMGRGVVANTSEFIVPMHGKQAIYNQDMAKQYGLPAGSKPVAAEGYSPNFALTKMGVKAIDPDLLAAHKYFSQRYPRLEGQMKFKVVPKDVTGRLLGEYDPNTNSAYITNSNKGFADYLSTLAHETRHSLQDKSGLFTKDSLAGYEQANYETYRNFPIEKQARRTGQSVQAGFIRRIGKAVRKQGGSPLEAAAILQSYGFADGYVPNQGEAISDISEQLLANVDGPYRKQSKGGSLKGVMLDFASGYVPNFFPVKTRKDAGRAFGDISKFMAQNGAYKSNSESSKALARFLREANPHNPVEWIKKQRDQILKRLPESALPEFIGSHADSLRGLAQVLHPQAADGYVPNLIHGYVPNFAYGGGQGRLPWQITRKEYGWEDPPPVRVVMETSTLDRLGGLNGEERYVRKSARYRELLERMKKFGFKGNQINPSDIILRRGADQSLKIEDGNHRIAAAFDAKISEIPVHIIESPLHKDIVQHALRQGKSVPSEVLADYPDLARQSTTAASGFVPNFAKIPLKPKTVLHVALGEAIAEGAPASHLAAMRKSVKGFQKISGPNAELDFSAFQSALGVLKRSPLEGADKAAKMLSNMTMMVMSDGYVPSFNNPVSEAVDRETSALQRRGLSASAARDAVYVSRDSRVHSPGNLIVANKIDEPSMMGREGVDRVLREGGNPNTAGMAKGFIPSFAMKLLTANRRGMELQSWRKLAHDKGFPDLAGLSFGAKNGRVLGSEYLFSEVLKEGPNIHDANGLMRFASQRFGQDASQHFRIENIQRAAGGYVPNFNLGKSLMALKKLSVLKTPERLKYYRSMDGDVARSLLNYGSNLIVDPKLKNTQRTVVNELADFTKGKGVDPFYRVSEVAGGFVPNFSVDVRQFEGKKWKSKNLSGKLADIEAIDPEEAARIRKTMGKPAASGGTIANASTDIENTYRVLSRSSGAATKTFIARTPSPAVPYSPSKNPAQSIGNFLSGPKLLTTSTSPTQPAIANLVPPAQSLLARIPPKLSSLVSLAAQIPKGGAYGGETVSQPLAPGAQLTTNPYLAYDRPSNIGTPSALRFLGQPTQKLKLKQRPPQYPTARQVAGTGEFEYTRGVGASVAQGVPPPQVKLEKIPPLYSTAQLIEQKIGADKLGKFTTDLADSVVKGQEKLSNASPKLVKQYQNLGSALLKQSDILGKATIGSDKYVNAARNVENINKQRARILQEATTLGGTAFGDESQRIAKLAGKPIDPKLLGERVTQENLAKLQKITQTNTPIAARAADISDVRGKIEARRQDPNWWKRNTSTFRSAGDYGRLAGLSAAPQFSERTLRGFSGVGTGLLFGAAPVVEGIGSAFSRGKDEITQQRIGRATSGAASGLSTVGLGLQIASTGTPLTMLAGAAIGLVGGFQSITSVLNNFEESVDDTSKRVEKLGQESALTAQNRLSAFTSVQSIGQAIEGGAPESVIKRARQEGLKTAALSGDQEVRKLLRDQIRTGDYSQATQEKIVSAIQKRNDNDERMLVRGPELSRVTYAKLFEGAGTQGGFSIEATTNLARIVSTEFQKRGGETEADRGNRITKAQDELGLITNTLSSIADSSKVNIENQKETFGGGLGRGATDVLARSNIYGVSDLAKKFSGPAFNETLQSAIPQLIANLEKRGITIDQKDLDILTSAGVSEEKRLVTANKLLAIAKSQSAEIEQQKDDTEALIKDAERAAKEFKSLLTLQRDFQRSLAIRQEKSVGIGANLTRLQFNSANRTQVQQSVIQQTGGGPSLIAEAQAASDISNASIDNRRKELALSDQVAAKFASMSDFAKKLEKENAKGVEVLFQRIIDSKSIKETGSALDDLGKEIERLDKKTGGASTEVQKMRNLFEEQSLLFRISSKEIATETQLRRESIAASVESSREIGRRLTLTGGTDPLDKSLAAAKTYDAIGTPTGIGRERVDQLKQQLNGINTIIEQATSLGADIDPSLIEEKGKLIEDISDSMLTAFDQASTDFPPAFQKQVDKMREAIAKSRRGLNADTTIEGAFQAAAGRLPTTEEAKGVERAISDAKEKARIDARTETIDKSTGKTTYETSQPAPVDVNKIIKDFLLKANIDTLVKSVVDVSRYGDKNQYGTFGNPDGAAKQNNSVIGGDTDSLASILEPIRKVSESGINLNIPELTLTIPQGKLDIGGNIVITLEGSDALTAYIENAINNKVAAINSTISSQSSKIRDLQPISELTPPAAIPA